jgi:hypothetical protein
LRLGGVVNCFILEGVRGGVFEEGVSCDLKLMFLVFTLLYFNNLQDIELFVVIEDSSR